MIREKQYLSWSQFSLWQTSKREYWKRYHLGEDRSSNKYFEKGRELSEALEYGSEDGISTDNMLSIVLGAIPKLDLMEYKVETRLKNGELTLSYLDSCSIDNEDFIEYKTGKIPWDQAKVNKHQQLAFYALALHIKSERTIIPKCKLIWIETEQTETEGLKYTGVLQEFEREFTLYELEAFEDELIKCIDEIEEFEYTELELDDEQVDRYIELSELVKSASAEMDLIRLDIQVRMEAEDMNMATATNGKFSISERKSWTYSDDLAKAQAEFAKQVKIAQAQEQKDGVAKCEISKSLRFSINKQK